MKEIEGYNQNLLSKKRIVIPFQFEFVHVCIRFLTHTHTEFTVG